MTRKRTTATAAALAVATLLVPGCSSDNGHQDHKATPSASASTTNPTTVVLQTARRYQEAANKLDWRTACTLSTANLRGGSVEDCITASTPGTPAPSVSSTPSPTVDPPRYADGSTPAPRATRTTGGPDRAATGPVTAAPADLVQAPATAGHPAGWGVLVSYTVTWPGKPVTTSRTALRLVAEAGGVWRIDQAEDVQPGDEGHGSPVLAALGG